MATRKVSSDTTMVSNSNDDSTTAYGYTTTSSSSNNTTATATTDISTGAPPSKQLKKGTTIKFSAQGFVTQQVGKLLEEYAIGDMLGSGGFGEVYLGKHKKSGAERAIKVVHKSPVDYAANQAIIHECKWRQLWSFVIYVFFMYLLLFYF